MLAVLAALCGVLAVLQYRWIAEISEAERARLKGETQQGLNQLARAFNEEVRSAIASVRDIEASAAALPPAIARVGRTSLRESGLALELWDAAQHRFQTSPWPQSWLPARDRAASRMDRRGPPPRPGADAVLELPRFSPGQGDPQVWLLVEMDMNYLQQTLIPRLISRHLSLEQGPIEVEMVSAVDPSHVLYSSGPGNGISTASEASVDLLGSDPGAARAPGPPPRWRLHVRYPPGALETLVARVRYRNLAVSLGILVLIAATGAMLARSTRQAQRLAEQQMNFAASVSHELRTPLTVIRTAAYNLRGKLSRQPDQVEKYGLLIERESEKLGMLVDQALVFAGMNAGQGAQKRELVDAGELITNSVQNRQSRPESRRLEIEVHVEAGLPRVTGDSVALAQVIENLIENAVKYGIDGDNWIGISACRRTGVRGSIVEIRVADRGRGIPSDELPHIFEPFYRGRQAIHDQVHGTGLGLHLVKRIVEAHGGSIDVNSAPGKGTEFTVRLPAADPESQDEFTHTAD